jgi:hypothetical protein
LAASEEDSEITLMDKMGVKRLSLRVDDTGPNVGFFGADKKLKMKLVGRKDAGEIVLYDRNETPALRVRGGHVEPQIVIYDATGRSRARLFVLNEGEDPLGSGLSLTDEDGANQVLVTALPDGTSAIRAGSTNLSLVPMPPEKTAAAPK